MIAQHGLIVEIAKGIYSFSHRTFHEYFVSLKIVKTLDPQEQNKLLNSLAIHISDYRWQEVFRLVACMLPQADYLIKLIKNEIDKIVEENEKISSFLTWLNYKSSLVKSKKEISNLKAIGKVFYFNLIVKNSVMPKKRRVSKDLSLDSDLIKILKRSLEVQSSIAKCNTQNSNTRTKTTSSKLRKSHKSILSCMKRCASKAFEIELQEELIDLRASLPNQIEVSDKWWIEDFKEWVDRFRAVILKHRNIGHHWDFTDSEIKSLKEYYDVNKLLAQCLKEDCYVSREVREEINLSILLPIDKV